ncbi:MAG TPA: SUF system Fe-S cluster assembly regulator [Candidatus Angelobacter sp.]|nr:SUF system Fe-S cluster assembly regulator [Candidatus Angelobacter sp.]
MFRLNKLTDYGIVLMTYVAANPHPSPHTAREMAAGTQMHAATVGKIVRDLVEHGLLVSHRGMKGGYSLARPPEKISIAEIIDALEGPIGFTECFSTPGCCELEPSCTVRSNSQVISRALRRTLEEISLTDLIRPLRLTGPAGDGNSSVVNITLTSGRTQ